jgi:hypothetical protein
MSVFMDFQCALDAQPANQVWEPISVDLSVRVGMVRIEETYFLKSKILDFRL